MTMEEWDAYLTQREQEMLDQDPRVQALKAQIAETERLLKLANEEAKKELQAMFARSWDKDEPETTG